MNTEKPNPYRAGFLNAQFWGTKEEHRQIWKPRSYELGWFTENHKIYHYTNLDGLMGILQSNGLWVNHIAYMNDSSEFLHGRQIAKEVLGGYLQQKKDNKFSDVLRGSIEAMNKPQHPDIYVTCFSTEGDSLDLWRGYTQHSTPVAIEFDLTICNPFKILPIMILERVVYGRLAQMRRILLLIKRYETEYEKDLEFYKNKLDDEMNDDYVNHLSRSIEAKLSVFKNPSFKNENEIRLVIHGTQNKQFNKKLYRSNKNFILPYFRTSDLKCTNTDGKSWSEMNPLPVSSIIVGPTPYSDLTLKSINQYLSESGHSVKVEKSTVPFQSFES